MLRSIINGLPFPPPRLWRRDSPIPPKLLEDAKREFIECFESSCCNRQRVAFLLGNEPAFVAAILAVMQRSDSAVLLNPALTPSEIGNILAQTGARLILASAESMAKTQALPQIGQQRARIAMGRFGHVIAFELLPPPVPIDVPQDELTCQITSGVSGRSRVVSRTYQNAINELGTYIDRVSVSASDKFLCPVPLFHAYGLFNGLLPALVTGATCILLPGLLPGDVVNLSRFHRPTILLGVPFIYELLSHLTGIEQSDLASYRFLFSAGAPITPQLADRLVKRFGIALNPLYGTTETGILALGLDRSTYLQGYVGAPLKGRNIRVFEQYPREAPIGEPGEVGIMTAATGKYLDRASYSTSLRDEWFFPGDLGRFDTEGNLYILGRKFALINVASLKVDPAEIEATIYSSGLAADCAVVGVPRSRYGEMVRAYVVPQNHATVQALRNVCRKSLAPFKVPREFVLVRELPRTSTGKVLRKCLTEATPYRG